MRKIKTMAEFAAVSGLSRPTVSKYFDDPASVRPTTRLRIEESLKRFGYRPNILAQSLNRRQPRIIGVIVPLATDPFYAELIRHIELRSIREGYLAIVLSSHGQRQLEVRAIETLLSLKVSGAIMAPLGFLSDTVLIRSLQSSIPLVFVDSRLDEDSVFVGTDNAQSIGLMVDYLLRTGERPTLVDLPAVNHNAAARRSAYLAAMARAGAEPATVEVAQGADWNFERLAYERALAILDGEGFATRTVLCANDRLAFGVMAAAFARRIKVGREPDSGLRVAGHDDHPLSRYTSPPLTTIAQDIDRLANLSTEVLLQGMGVTAADDGSPAGSPARHLLPGRLVMRESA